MSRRVFYKSVRSLFLPLGRICFGLEVIGADRIPPLGGAILVAPHRSWLDPPCVGAITARPIRFLIMDRVFNKPWARWFYRGMQAIPVTQSGHGSISALRGAMRALQAGWLIGVFPEGRVLRPGDTGKIHPGAALLAVRCGVPIVPIGIHGTADAWPRDRRLPRRGKVRMAIGEPIPPPAERSRRAVDGLVQAMESAMEGLSRSVAP